MSGGMRVVLAATWLFAAGITASCGSTVDGVATCPDCGPGNQPGSPSTEPSTPANQPGALTPNTAGYVYIETSSGLTRCQISADSVGCESEFADPPVIDGIPANGVEVSASGSNRWVVGNLGAMPTVTIDYDTYHAVGWTIEAAGDGTTFTNDDTGHGMFVSTGEVEFF